MVFTEMREGPVRSFFQFIVLTNWNMAHTKRPRLVWVILFFYILSVAWSVLIFTVAYKGVVPLKAEQKAVFQHLRFVDRGLLIGGPIFNLAGAVLLFQLRKLAIWFFVAVILLSVTSTAMGGLTSKTNVFESLGHSAFLGMVIGWVIGISVIRYATGLKQVGVLR